MLLIAKVLAHLPDQRGLEHALGQLAQQPTGAHQLDVLLLRLLQKLLSKLLLIKDICSHRPDHPLPIGRID
jgi:hypothetical protein